MVWSKFKHYVKCHAIQSTTPVASAFSVKTSITALSMADPAYGTNATDSIQGRAGYVHMGA